MKQHTDTHTCSSCRLAHLRTTGNSFTIKERKPFLCDCAADESQKPASIDRYGNRLTMIINHPHHCPAYQGTTQN